MSPLGQVMYYSNLSKWKEGGGGWWSWRSAKHSIGSQWIVKRLTEGRRGIGGWREKGETWVRWHKQERVEEWKRGERRIWCRKETSLDGLLWFFTRTHNEIQLRRLLLLFYMSQVEFTAEWSVFVSFVCVREVLPAKEWFWFHIINPVEVHIATASHCGQPSIR